MDNFSPPVPRAWSFPEKSVAELARRIERAGPGATLSVFPYESGGLILLHLRVLAVDGAMLAEDEPDINDSKPCPPWTGCGGGS